MGSWFKIAYAKTTEKLLAAFKDGKIDVNDLIINEEECTLNYINPLGSLITIGNKSSSFTSASEAQEVIEREGMTAGQQVSIMGNDGKYTCYTVQANSAGQLYLEPNSEQIKLTILTDDEEGGTE